MSSRPARRTRSRAVAPFRSVLALAALVAAACGAPRLAPRAAAGSAPPLPPVPLVEGPLRPRVQYPPRDAAIGARDSNFIFGSVGTGRATLTINGVPVAVLPNGAWLAWLPLPPADRPRYEIVAVAGADTVRLAHPVRLTGRRAGAAPVARTTMELAAAAPAGARLPAGETVRVSVRAPAEAQPLLHPAVVASPGPISVAPRDTARRPAAAPRSPASPVARPPADRRDSLTEHASLAGGATLAVPLPVALRRSPRDPELFIGDVDAALLRQPAVVRDARAGSRLAPVTVPAVAALDSFESAAVGAVLAPAPGDSFRTIVGRPEPGGTYKYFFLPGTPVAVTGLQGASARVRLDAGLSAWVDTADLRDVGRVATPARRTIGNLRVTPAPGWADVLFSTGERLPHTVEQQGDALVVTLYGATANTDIITYGRADPLVRHIVWEQVATDRARYTVHLNQRPYGYQVLFGAAGLVLRVRRAPAVDAARPLAGLTIAVDPGHPPAGATGPTGLYEGVATLAIGERLQRILVERGATVLMTRTTADAVALGERPVMAARANAHALVSIHLNALPDGVNPYAAQGTGAYYFHPQAEPLARALQAGMVEQMGLPNLGVYYDNLALARPTWMPAVLCEGAFIMIPEQEAALRTPEFQERYARGVADGLEAYFRSLAR